MHTPDGLTEEVSDGEHGELCTGTVLVMITSWKRSLESLWSAGGLLRTAWVLQVYTTRAPFVQQLGALGDVLGRVDHAVHHDDDLSPDIMDEVHHLGLVVARSPLVDDRQRRVRELLGEGARPGHPSHVRRHHHHVLGADGLAG